jgi:hypothetical protein
MGGAESAACRNIKWRENTLAKSKAFRLQGRKAFAAGEAAFDIALSGVAAPHRAAKKQRHCYLAKKKRDALKTELLAGRPARLILCLAHGKGRRHGVRLFKPCKLRLHPVTKAVAGSVYQGR